MTKAQQTLRQKLEAPFPIENVSWRAQLVGRGGDRALALCYLDARDVMARLDDVVGPENWRDSYRFDGNRMICRLEIRVPRDDSGHEWIGKEDGSGDSNFEGEKGGISGALKRAAVKWGIGRYLYDVEAIWADCKAERKRNGRGYDFKGWTDAGVRQLAAALERAPGPRTSEAPGSVQVMMEGIENARDLDELQHWFSQNWRATPMEYRKAILEAKDRRKVELMNEIEAQEDEGYGRSEQGGDYREFGGRPGDQVDEFRGSGRQYEGRDERDMEGPGRA